MSVFKLMWVGLWQGLGQGVGLELSFLALFWFWVVFYRNHKHRFDADHFLHVVHDYFTK